NEVSVSMGVGQIVMEPREPRKGLVPDFSSRLTRSNWNRHTLRMDEKFTISTADLIMMLPPDQLAFADIAIVVSYQPWWLPFRREKIFRFVTYRQTLGHIYWYSEPLE
ncbi:MAG: hypothetical protein M1451_03325, partial [Acidobacteria bacterium]|nr:hypothetical protein [Acidobacteriota bacterium]